MKMITYKRRILSWAFSGPVILLSGLEAIAAESNRDELPPECPFRISVQAALCETNRNIICAIIENHGTTKLFLNALSLKHPNVEIGVSWFGEKGVEGGLYGATLPPAIRQWWQFKGRTGQWGREDVVVLEPGAQFRVSSEIGDRLKRCLAEMPENRKTWENEHGAMRNEKIKVRLKFSYFILETMVGAGKEARDVTVTSPWVVWQERQEKPEAEGLKRSPDAVVAPTR